MSKRKGKNILFALLAACILLAGALAAGLSTRAVVEPQVGQVMSAGALNVPTVLGHTAEEVLFYPWPMYDAQTLYPLTDDIVDAEVFRLMLEPARAMGAGDIDIDAALETGRTNFDPDTLRPPSGLSAQLFLKDQSAGTDPAGTPVDLSFAISEDSIDNNSISYLVRPARQRELSEQQQAQALTVVEADLQSLLLQQWEENGLTQVVSDFYSAMSESYLGGVGVSNTFELFFTENQYYAQIISEDAELPSSEMSNSELKQLLSDTGCSTQIISTPQQIVVLFTLSDGHLVGVYYDIQLERYSGIGLTY